MGRGPVAGMFIWGDGGRKVHDITSHSGELGKALLGDEADRFGTDEQERSRPVK